MASDLILPGRPRSVSARVDSYRARRILEDPLGEITHSTALGKDERIVPMILPKGLFKLLEKSTNIYTVYDEQGLSDHISVLSPEALSFNIQKLGALTCLQGTYLDTAIAPQFAKETYASPEHFTRGYEMLAGLLTHTSDSEFSTWPVEVEDMSLDCLRFNELDDFMMDLSKKVSKDQPYLVDFALGGARDYFVIAGTREPEDAYERIWRERMVLSGMGLASLHLENMVLSHAEEAAIYAENFPAT